MLLLLEERRIQINISLSSPLYQELEWLKNDTQYEIITEKLIRNYFKLEQFKCSALIKMFVMMYHFCCLNWEYFKVRSKSIKIDVVFNKVWMVNKMFFFKILPLTFNTVSFLLIVLLLKRPFWYRSWLVIGQSSLQLEQSLRKKLKSNDWL